MIWLIVAGYLIAGIITAVVMCALDDDSALVGMSPFIIMVWPIFVVFGGIFGLVEFLARLLREKVKNGD